MAWAAIRGHGDLVGGFQRALARGRMAHAFLFAGPEGVGKRLFARALAQTLLCQRADPNGHWDACGQCSECALFQGGTHPDYFEVRRPEDRLEFAVADMRALCRNLSLKPARGSRRIAVIDDADDLNDESANCFLKTLEEPPPGSLLLIVGTTMERQLPTIRSRCQVVSFAPLPDADVVALLTEQDIPAETAQTMAARAAGSPGLGMALAEPDVREFCDEFARYLDDSPRAPAPMAVRFRELVEAAGKESAAQRGRASLLLKAMAGELRRRLLTAGDERDERRLLRWLERCFEADAQVDRRVQLVLVLEAFVQALAT